MFKKLIFIVSYCTLIISAGNNQSSYFVLQAEIGLALYNNASSVASLSQSIANIVNVSQQSVNQQLIDLHKFAAEGDGQRKPNQFQNLICARALDYYIKEKLDKYALNKCLVPNSLKLLQLMLLKIGSLQTRFVLNLDECQFRYSYNTEKSNNCMHGELVRTEADLLEYIAEIDKWISNTRVEYALCVQKNLGILDLQIEGLKVKLLKCLQNSCEKST